MKKNLQVVRFALIFGLTSMLFVGCESNANKEENKTSDAEQGLKKGETFPVAYIDTDSLLRQYKYAIYLQEELLKKEEKNRTDFNVQAKKLQSQFAEFQRKVQNNGFLSRQRAEQEQKNLVAKEKELQNLNNKLSQELMVDQDKLNRQLRDTLSNYLKEFNADKRYKLILSNTLGDNILYSVPGINITQEIADALNSRYEGAKGKVEEKAEEAK